MNTPETAALDTGRPAVKPAVVLAVLAISSLAASLMQSLVIPIQPFLAGLLDTTQSNASWVVTATLLGGAVAMPVSGRLADLIGKKPVLVGSAIILMAGSLLCAVTSDLAPMLIGRVLQGMAMGYIPVAISFVRELLPPKMVTNAVAIISAMLGVGGALGLPLAAWIAQDPEQWHTLFWVAFGLAVAMTLGSALLLPNVKNTISGRLDWIGAVGLGIGLVAFLVGISKGKDWGWTSGTTLGAILGGLVVLAIWGFYQLRTTEPLVDLRTTANRPVLLTNLAGVVIGFAMMAQALVIPQLLEAPGESGWGLGQSVLATGFWMAPGGLMMMLFAPVSSLLIKKIGGRYTLSLGAAIVALGYVLAIFMTGEPWLLMIAVCIGSAGIGIGYAAMPTVIMENVPPTEVAASVGLNSLMRSVGTTIAGAVMAVVLSSTLASFQWAFVICAAAALIGSLLGLAVYPLKGKKLTPEELQKVAVKA